MLTESRFVYSTAQQMADAAAGPILVSVVQLGTHAQSRAAEIVVQD